MTQVLLKAWLVIYLSYARQKKVCMALALAGLLYCSVTPVQVFADNKSNAASAKTDANKPGAPDVNTPAPLTERERLLLDRVEQLEKRVVELENKMEAPVAAAGLSSPATAATVVLELNLELDSLHPVR